MNALHDLKDMMIDQLEDYGKKGELSTQVLERVDMLAHATKNLEKVIESCEGEEFDDMDDYSGRSYRRYNSGNGYSGRMSSRRRSYRGRSNRGYSRNGDLAEQLYGMMDNVQDDQTRQEIERLASKMEQM